MSNQTNNKLTITQLHDRAEGKVRSLKSAIDQSAFTNIRRELEEELQLAEYALAALQEYRKASKEPVMYTVTFEGQIEEIGGDCQGFKREDCQHYIEWLRDEDNQVGYAVTPLYAAPPQAVTVPDGWVMVPIDATRAMIDAAELVEEDGYDAMHKAMLAAAPQPPSNPSQLEKPTK